MWISRAVVVCGLLLLQSPSAEHLRSALEAASKDSPDGTDFAETHGYRDLVEALIEFKPIDVQAQQPTPIDAARALAEPASMRGTWVVARGHAVLQMPIALQTPIGSVKQVERIMLKLEPDAMGDQRMDHSPRQVAEAQVLGQKAIACDLIGDPPPFKNTDTVQIAGVFFRTVTFDNDKHELATLPYVLVRSMEVVETPSSTLGKSLLNGGPQFYAGILFGLVGVVVLVLYLRHSARSET